MREKQSHTWLAWGFIAILILSFISLAIATFSSTHGTYERRVVFVGPDDEAFSLLHQGRPDAEIIASIQASEKHPDDIVLLGGTLLMHCVFEQRLGLVEWLLTNGADPNSEGIQLKPLWAAIENSDESMIDLLINHGADPQLKIVPDEDSSLTFEEYANLNGLDISNP